MSLDLLYTGPCRNRWKATTKNQAELEGMANLLTAGYITQGESIINFIFAIKHLSTNS